MNEILKIKSLEKIPSRKITQKLSCSPAISPNSRMRILSPSNEINYMSRSPTLQSTTPQIVNLMKREAVKRKLNFLTATLQSKKTEIVKQDDAFSDRLIVKSFENFVDDTNDKITKIQNIISTSPRMQQELLTKEILFCDNVEEMELKLNKTIELLAKRKGELKVIKSQCIQNQLLLKNLKLELDSLVEDHKILEYCTDQSIQDEISNNSISFLKSRQLGIKLSYQLGGLSKQLISQDCAVGKCIDKFKRSLLDIMITLDTKIVDI